MFAVVDIKGQQFKVSENSTYYVPRLQESPESNVSFQSVILIGDEKGTKVGSPFLSGVKVSAKVLEHVKDEKVLVFKKKRRIGYKKKNGHRQQLTKIEVTKIG